MIHPGQSMDLMRHAIVLVLTLSAPPILAASVVGLLIGIVQSATQIQDQTTQYAGKFLGVCIAILITSVTAGRILYNFCDDIFMNFWRYSGN